MQQHRELYSGYSLFTEKILEGLRKHFLHPMRLLAYDALNEAQGDGLHLIRP